MNSINYEMAAFLRYLGHNPAAMLHILACACAITLIIAIVTDALVRQRESARGGKTLGKPPKPRSALMLRPQPALELAKADSRPVPHEAGRSRL